MPVATEADSGHFLDAIRADYPQQAASGRGVWLRWLFSAVWLVYLADPLYYQFTDDHSVLHKVAAVLIAAAFCAAYVPLVAQAANPGRLARWGVITLAGIAVAACAVYGSDWIGLWIYVSAATGYELSGRTACKKVLFAALASVTVAYTLLAVVSHTDLADYLIILIPVLFLGWSMAGFRLQAALVLQLAAARNTVAKLAASEERLRLARDMHDLTGQSLSTITLKADLAVRRLQQLPQDEQTAAISKELGDIAQVSRQTLHDIRDAVSGYRRPTLAVEMVTARDALEAAGIAVDEDPAVIALSGGIDADAEAALAWCLREAVTNVVRHSSATTCRIRLVSSKAEFSLEVADDGQGMRQSPAKARGSGLRNMAERLAATGGRLTLAPRNPGLRLTAAVPA